MSFSKNHWLIPFPIMNHAKQLVWCTSLMIVLSCVSCSSMTHPVRLPIGISVLDKETGVPIPKARVELQWRCGFFGYYWGELIAKSTDINGVVNFASVDIPPRSEDGYSLGKEIRKLYISTIIVSIPGYEVTVFSYPDASKEIRLRVKKGCGERVIQKDGTETYQNNYPRGKGSADDPGR